MLSMIGNLDWALGQLKGASLIKNNGNGESPRPPLPFRYAQSSITYSQPSFYSPIHTAQNWQIPQNRKNRIMWCRYFAENEPKVAGTLDIYSSFAFNGFETQCEHGRVKSYIDHFNKKVDLDHWFKVGVREYLTIGEVYFFADIECPVCHGSGINEKGNVCNHPGGTFTRLRVLLPETLEVQADPLTGEEQIYMLPNDVLKRIVWTRQKPFYDKIAPYIRNLISQNMPIPLDKHCVTHLKFNPNPTSPYGESLLQRLFKTLAYKDKLMQAQWIVAERLILPIRLVNVGTDDHPATGADIADIQQQLSATANDPNLTLVTHHAVKFDWVGASGKVLTLSNELEYIDKEILQGLMMNDALLSGSMGGYQCHDMQTKALTRNGFKYYDEITNEDEIGCFNQNTGELEYHKPIAKHCSDFDGELIQFKTNRLDIAVTENHNMLFQSRDSNEWKTAPANKIKKKSKFRKTVKWKGNENIPLTVKLGNKNYSLNDYLELIAFYVTEGYCKKETRKERSTYGDSMSVCIYQTEKGKAWNKINALKDRINMTHISSDHGDQFVIHNKAIATQLSIECGNGSAEKKIPTWIKDLPTHLLKKFLNDMIDGDGCRQLDDRGIGKHYRNRYYTKSFRLKEDIMEIALKCGYYPHFVFRQNETGGIFEIMFSDKDLMSDTLVLLSKNCNAISKLPYKGKVWCFTVPTGFFITERNGKIAIQGNSAAIGAEAMIQRMESTRLTFSRFAENRLYLPIAQMRGYVDEAKTKELQEETGEPAYIVPKIQWNDMNLRDDTQQKQLIVQLVDKQIISKETCCEKFGYDYDQETMRLRYENSAQQLMGGGGAEAGGGMPMGGGGMDMGGMGGGAMPGADLGGGMDMGGGGPQPTGMDMGGGAGAAGAASALGGTAGKLLGTKRGKSLRLPEEEEVKPANIRLTSLEQKMVKILTGIQQQSRMPFPIMMQYPIYRWRADFAIPQIGLLIECDGKVFHDGEKAVKDVQRDQTLMQYGWTTARFKEDEIEKQDQAISSTLNSLIHKLWAKKAKQTKKQAENILGIIKQAETTESTIIGEIIEPKEDEEVV